MHKEQIIICFDFGLKHIGVAIGQTLTRTARGVATLQARNGKPKWHQIHSIIADFGPHEAVVGLPLNMDGTPATIFDDVTAFATKLGSRTQLRVSMHDERLTTKAAKTYLQDAIAMGIATTDHELAACLILEGWFETQLKT